MEFNRRVVRRLLGRQWMQNGGRLLFVGITTSYSPFLATVKLMTPFCRRETNRERINMQHGAGEVFQQF